MHGKTTIKKNITFIFLETDAIEQERGADCFQQNLAPPFSVTRNEMPLT
jgi:hypothetical protein